jgi:hypothetical protein
MYFFSVLLSKMFSSKCALIMSPTEIMPASLPIANQQIRGANQGTVYLNGFQGDESGDSFLKWLSARLLAFQRSSGL